MIDRMKVLGELLTKLERREAALMEWGFFDVVHTSDELIELFANDSEWGAAFQEIAEGSEELFVDNLAECQLLYRVDDGYPRRYRSRFAESLRLLARLRQRFRTDDWTHAPELVSQVRLHLAPRRFPVRNQAVDQVWQAISPASWSQTIQRKVLQALVSGEPPLKLAAFQARAIKRILAHYRGAAEPSGTVVTAGTGGGKTKSFYIPALMGIAADVSHDPAPATRVLALYPRNVLLADQFAEAASQAAIVHRAGLLKRPISVGALIGEVPYNSDFESYQPNKWALAGWPQARLQKGRLLPHLRHPDSGERLVWTDVDRLSGKTILRRDTTAGEVVFPDGVVCLTRDDLIKRPPDIFLTSIEMLNKELSGEIGRAVLGFGATASPLRMVLLDEAHTYEGVTGAQVPWILRRLAHWMRPVRRDRQIHYVGLSATLQDAPDHLAVLTGIQVTRIVEIAPRITPDELSIEGQEYNVVLKSHPGSGAGVLSTSIQTAMLGARLLTPAGAKAQPTAVVDATQYYGRKVFGFTDNLDVVNRWLPNLISAEQKLRLARLREPQVNDAPMDAAGQVWKLPVWLGHNLQSRLQVERISSQDPGIDSRADIVIATSSLEVGYDDPEVGMVLQHKAPRSAASFLQRKGRAGRRQGMRPWTVVVLTDHGRDRWAFRDSEQLFNPVLERLSLPVFNPYLLRIQATWFLVDWIAFKIGKASPNLYLTRFDYRRDDVERLVNNLLSVPALRQEFSNALESWLGGRSGGFRVIDAAGLARSLLWSPPRAVLRHVVPELRKFMDGGYQSQGRRARLLPRFLPATTWDILDSQEVELHLDGEHSQLMDASRALYEAVPGRVSRRFVVNPRAPSKWPAFSAQLVEPSGPSVVRIDDLCRSWVRNDELTGLTLFQPTEMDFEDVPDKVKNSSNAQWGWELIVRVTGSGGPLSMHTQGSLAQVFEDSRTWLHRDQTPLHAYWLARGCRYEIHLDKDQVRRGVLDVGPPKGDTPLDTEMAIGYTRSVDGVQLILRRELIATVPELPEAVRQEMRTGYLRHLASQSGILLDRASLFGIDNLCTSAVGMIVATALHLRIGLEQAWTAIPDKAKAAVKVMRSILSVDDDGHDAHNRRLAEMTDLWQSPEIKTEIDALVQVLWAPLDERFDHWLQRKFIETIRAAVEEATRAVLPEASEGALKVEAITEADTTSILILEADPGGVGIVERLLLVISSDPDQFNRAFEWALSFCPADDTRSTILATVRQAREPYSEMREAFDNVRSATDYRASEGARLMLVSSMSRNDLPASKRHVTSLLSKVLGPGSSRETERWLDGLSRTRLRVGQRIATAVDCRSFAYWLSNQSRARTLMRATLRNIFRAEPDEMQIYQAFVRLTLEPCTDSCSECLGNGKEAIGLEPSRRLASLWMGARPMHIIDVDDGETWAQELLDALHHHARVRLRHCADQRTLVATTLATMMTLEIDRGHHSSPLRVSGARRNAGRWETDIEVDSWEGL
jgi:hypothetical protein